VTLAAPPWIRYYGVAYVLRDVPPERRAFAFDVTTIDMKYLLIKLLSVPCAILLLATAVALYVYERQKEQNAAMINEPRFTSRFRR
jgi:signal transduction histidine kinase